MEDGQCVAEGLAAGRGGDDGDILPGQGASHGFLLVAVEVGDAPPGQCVDQRRIQVIGDGRGLGGPGWQGLPGGHIRHKAGVPAQVSEKRGEGHKRYWVVGISLGGRSVFC